MVIDIIIMKPEENTKFVIRKQRECLVIEKGMPFYHFNM